MARLEGPQVGIMVMGWIWPKVGVMVTGWNILYVEILLDESSYCPASQE